MNKELVGIYIKNRRMQLGITQLEVAESLNVSVQAISKWENGNSYPDFVIIGKLSALLKVSVDDFFKLKIPSSTNIDSKEFNYLTFGQTINKYLKNRNLTQLDLAKKTNINQSTISNIINGKAYTTINQFIDIANCLKVGYSDLYYSIYKEKNSNGSTRNVVKKSTILSLSFALVLTTLGIVIFNNKDNKDTTNTDELSFIDGLYYPHVEFWDEHGNLIDAQRIPHNQKIQYYPEVDAVVGWNKKITTSSTSTIFQLNKNPYRYFFYIYGEKESFFNGYDSLDNFSNFKLSRADCYFDKVFKDSSNNIVDVYSLNPGIYTLYGKEKPIKTHTISFPTSLNIDPIEIRDCEIIPDFPVVAYNDYLIKGYQYNNKELITYDVYSFEKSIEVQPIFHSQETHIDDDGFITYLKTNEDLIIVPDSIGNHKVKGIKQRAVKLNYNNKKLLFLNKNKIICKDIFDNDQFIDNISDLEFRYNFITNDSYLGNISNLNNVIFEQRLDYYGTFESPYCLIDISLNPNFHIDNLYYCDEVSGLLSFKDLNVDDVYFESKARYACLGSDYMFRNSSIKNFHFPSKFLDIFHLTINEGTFYNCKNLVSFIFPKNTNICGDRQFYGCENLEKVIFYGDINMLSNNMFYGTKVKELSVNNIDVIKENAFRNSLIQTIHTVNVEHIENGCYIPSSLMDFYLGGFFVEPIKFANLNNSLKVHYIDYNVFEKDRVENKYYQTCVNCLCRHKGELNDYWVVNKI